ncbi:hypothetical protein HMPREF9946_03258 [Acetobacteraceae bacterium AT-5844]|nr:hypothetical protein HMPREF9946_03258 [Acetobacteraceae bacterium AT-5844]
MPQFKMAAGRASSSGHIFDLELLLIEIGCNAYWTACCHGRNVAFGGFLMSDPIARNRVSFVNGVPGQRG